ncbi:hypothetical protein FQN49_004505 [Arthroderma sp. PD_2]|nr:hypothetical protein FQN49_004505 [Arthroderma sp. PD_2]
MRVRAVVNDCDAAQTQLITSALEEAPHMITVTYNRLVALEAILHRYPDGNLRVSGIDRSTLYTYEAMFGSAYAGPQGDNTKLFERLRYLVVLFKRMKDGLLNLPMEIWCNHSYKSKNFPPDYQFPAHIPPNERGPYYWDTRPAERGGQRLTLDRGPCGTGTMAATVPMDNTGIGTFDLLYICMREYQTLWSADPSMATIRETQFHPFSRYLDDREIAKHLSSILIHELSHSKTLLTSQRTFDRVGRDKAYGFHEVYYHARTNPNHALTNADNIAYFTIAMYLSKFNWSIGSNKPMYDDGPLRDSP